RTGRRRPCQRQYDEASRTPGPGGFPAVRDGGRSAGGAARATRHGTAAPRQRHGTGTTARRVPRRHGARTTVRRRPGPATGPAGPQHGVYGDGAAPFGEGGRPTSLMCPTGPRTPFHGVRTARSLALGGFLELAARGDLHAVAGRDLDRLTG